ncbi:MAG TPA: protein kinase [Gaiellaceae bacterium]|nr:protein kinase [Gaiellaceae bacterium]
MVGDVLADRYELEELVGTGGMSSVYKAHDRLLDRTVALKVLHQQYSSDDDYVERFRREARSVATLTHPNIVTVIDRGEHGDRQFIVFEYVDGDNLKRMIERRGPAPVETALEIGIQMARALAFAHQNGLVHRDVKPQNVLLNGDGQAKVTDFGIARSLDVQHGMTQTGTVLGTSDYIAPEQAQGQRVDEQTDVYSLGVVLYELLTSHVPFPGENFVAVAMRHINEEPPSIRDERPDVPVRVDAAIRRAMAKRPEDRFASMGELVVELEACLAELDGDTQGTQVIAPAKPSRRARKQSRPARPGRLAARHRPRVSPWPLITALSVLIAIGAVIAVVLLRQSGVHFPGTGGTSKGGGGAGTTSVHVTASAAYDPFGDGHEHDEDVAKATDGQPGTFWETEHYNDAPSLNKPGVGLVLDAGSAVHLSQLGIATGTPGFVAEIKASDSPTSFPTVVASSQTVAGQTRFQITASGSYRYYLIWITRLGPNYQNAEINEVDAS